MSFVFNKPAVLLLSAASAVALCAPSASAALPQFAGRLSARQVQFNDFIRRNANKEVFLSVVFDPLSGSDDPKKVKEPAVADGHDQPAYAGFSVANYYYVLDAGGQDWEKQTRYDAASRHLKGTFRVSSARSYNDLKGVKSYSYWLRFLPNRPNPVNPAAKSVGGQIADEFQVVPGERIGRVFLGDSRETVHRRLGPPDGPAYPIAAGLTAEAWPAKSGGSGDAATRGLIVIYRKNSAVQIEATTTAFRTPGGLNYLSSPEAWSRAYGRRDSVVLYKFPGSGKRPVGYEDWLKKGFAYKYEFLPIPKGADENEDSPIKAVSLIVHRRGERVIPDANAQWNGGDSSAQSPS